MMIKRFIAAGLAVVFGLGCVPAYGGEKEVSTAGTETKTEASAEDIFEKYDIVNGVMRYDCLAGIMKTAGLQAETFIYDYNITIDSYFYEDSDYYSYPYAELAKKLDITTGEEGTNEYGTVKQYFYPERMATVSECVSFMLPVMGYSSGVIDYDSAFNTAKDVGLIKEDDSFYSDGDITLTYEIYTTLLKRMLNSKRYMYFTELNNNTYINKDKYRFFDESGEMTYLEYLVSHCPEDLSKSQNAEEEILKHYNIISVPYLTCLMAVTKIAGMRVDGLFKDDDKRSAIVDASCLEGSELEIVKRKGYFLDNEANYGREIIIFSRTYGIVSSQQDSRLSFHENADVSVCANYIMHILADISENMTEDEIYSLAKEKGIVKPEDSFYDNPSERLDYEDFITLITRMLNSERYIYFTDEDEENWFNALCYDENGELTYYEYLLSLPEKVITEDDLFKEYSVINGVTRYDCLAGIMKAAGLQVETFYDDCDIIFEGYAFSDTSAKSTYPYVEFAYDYGIISGEEPPEGSGYKSKFFYPQRIATVEECIEFMLPLLTDVPENMDYEYVLSSARDIGLIYETDSFYYDSEKVLTYEIYEVLLKRMLNMKRYMYFTEFETDVNKFISSLKYRFYDENGEMTYLEYLTSLCPKRISESQSIEDEVIKYYNIISVPYLNCLMAVTKIAGMRVEGLFDDEDRLVSIAETSCLKGNELEIVIDPKRYYADEVQYGQENILFARTYGIIKNSRDSNLYYYGNADVSICVDYIMHILADVECMTDNEIYALAREKGIVKPEDSFYDNPSERLDYNSFKTLLTRFLNSQRYIYFTEEDENNWFNALCYDEEGKMTYYEYLISIDK